MFLGTNLHHMMHDHYGKFQMDTFNVIDLIKVTAPAPDVGLTNFAWIQWEKNPLYLQRSSWIQWEKLFIILTHSATVIERLLSLIAVLT